MQWDADLYDSKHEFVSQYGRNLLGELNLEAGQSILDLGCGTRKLSGDLAAKGAKVTGVDSSPEMVERARKNHPELEFLVADATRLPYENIFDSIFSNAVFHWIADQNALLDSIFRALKPGGILLCEFGAERNTGHIFNAFQEEFSNLGQVFENPFYYPSTQEYSSLLLAHGFDIEFVRDFDRPTPLNDGADGLRNWLAQFYTASLSKLSVDNRDILLSRVEKRLKPLLWDGEKWIADYRRIQAKARKPIDA